MKSRITAAALGIALLSVLCQALPAAALEPHEDPATAPLVFDGVAVLQKYSQALDGITKGNTTGLAQLREQAVPANIPPELRNTVESFLSSSYSLAGLIPLLAADLENSKTLLAQYRVDDARQSFAGIRDRLNQAYSALLVMDNAAADTGQWWKATTAPAAGPLRRAYDDVQTKLKDLRQFLDLLNDTFFGLTQAEMLPNLHSTNLTLAVEPETAFVGDRITFRGILTSEGRPMSGRIVTLLVDNVSLSSKLTNNDGVYQGEVMLPYRYVPEMTVQAIFAPVGNDIGQYLGASSPPATIKVLFYKSGLNVTQGTPAHPGRDFLVQAAFDYGENPALEARHLVVYLDEKPVLEITAGTAFFLRLSVPADTDPGMHRVTCNASARGRYAPAGARLDIEVTMITPVITVAAPGLLLLPFSHDIRGRVYSSLGPLANAGVEITLGGWGANAATRDDGTFAARLATGMSLTWLGSQELRVDVTPNEPWYQAGSTAVRVLVINPVNIAGILLILTVPVLLFRLRRRAARPLPPDGVPAIAPASATAKRDDRPLPAFPAAAAPDTAGSLILALYRWVLCVVQAVTALVLPPYQTLREFAQRSAPGLGVLGPSLGKDFLEFTAMVERLLYSRHRATEAEAARAREFSGKLMESGK